MKMRRRIIFCLKTIIGIFLTTTTLFSIFVTMPDWDSIHPKKQQSNRIYTSQVSNNVLAEHDKESVIPKKMFRRFAYDESDVRDWLDHDMYNEQMSRKGLGELGRAANLSNIDKEAETEIYKVYGYNALLSNEISLNRSVPDIRHPKCKRKKYLSQLPEVSIVMPFYNEHITVIMRSCMSILLRSPPELIREIILVDDASTIDELGEQLDSFVAQNVPKTRVIRLQRRSGLIYARIAGAKVATADILIFFDAHVEPNYNWLPPLIEPIAKDPKTCVCPFIDVIAHKDFGYNIQDEGARGAFDWTFSYTRLPLLPEDLVDPTKPFKSPIMTGGLLAIGTKFFWDIGGYDEELDIWGGEQFEISFKIWMCGGQMLDAPCSRVAHIFRGPGRVTGNPRNDDFLHKNFKRVAEVWMDEYKEYIYMRQPEIYKNIDAGDLSKPRAVRERLQCKSFKWFMENIAFDIPKYYPPIEPSDYAFGMIKSAVAPDLCLDTLNHHHEEPIGLYLCGLDPLHPHANQFWVLSYRKDLRAKFANLCLDVPKPNPKASVLMYFCHGMGGHQYWEYDIEKQWLINDHDYRRCLEADIENHAVFVDRCDVKNLRMKWSFGYINETAMLDFPANRNRVWKRQLIERVPR